jgi:hypothetical protein
MKCDWIFLNKDGSKDVVTLDGDAPKTGDGKVHIGRGYTVRHVVSGRTTSNNDAVIATEH